ncbi:MAG: hypothetical protein NC133_03425 [Prevotella sp.]|nr:hypothetical protein [Prevotella sp.]
MLFTLWATAFVIAAGTWWWAHRNRYWLVQTKTAGQVKLRIVRLPLQHIDNAKLRREIKIFNHLCLVLPTVDGVAVAYRAALRALLQNPQQRPSTDPYERLFHGYACNVLAQKVSDEVTKRQLRRNLTFLLAPSKKIVKRMAAVWSRQRYQFTTLPIFKIFNDCYYDPLQPAITADRPWQVVAHGSYLKYYHAAMVVKQYAHAYTLEAATTQTVTLRVAPDKSDFDCQVSRGVVTCKHLGTSESHTYAVRGEHVRLATSICAKTDALEIYITWQGQARISLDGGQAQWLPTAEVATNQRLENLVTAAYQAQFMTGERLRTRYLAAAKIVPSLTGLTRVFAVNSATEFLAVWDNLGDYRRLAQLFHGFSLVFLYSSTSSVVADTVMATVTAQQLAACHAHQLWLYFVDRTVTDPDAWYYLHKLTQTGHYVAPAPTPPGLQVTKTWPYVKTLTVTNTLAQKMTRDLVVPLPFNRFTVVSTNGTILTAVSLLSGRVSTYVLPTAIHVTGEWLTTHVNVPLQVKLAGYETRQFTITRREGNTKTRLTKRDLATALSEIQVRTTDKKLDALFTKSVIDGEDVALLAAVKAAYQNQDRKLLLAALSDRHQITADVWQYLLTQFVGLRVRAGKIYLTPCVNVMGEFNIAFTCQDQKYAFNTRKNLPSSTKFATIKYGNTNG